MIRPVRFVPHLVVGEFTKVLLQTVAWLVSWKWCLILSWCLSLAWLMSKTWW